MSGCARVEHEAEPHTPGREDVLLQLDGALLNSAQSNHTQPLRSCNLYGVAGIGKTQLAIQFALSREWQFDVIFWVQANEIAKLDESFSRIARALQIQDTSGGDDESINRKVVLDWLSDPRRGAVANGKWPVSTFVKWLVVFDNVVDEESIQQYWPPGGHGSILTISRTPMTRLESNISIDKLAWTLSNSTVFLQTLVLTAAAPTLKISQKICKGSSWTSNSVYRDRNNLETKTLVRALIIVAYAFRPLDVKELVEALTTRLQTTIHCQDQKGDAPWLGSTEDLKTLCIGFLEISERGLVEFSHVNMRSSLLTHSLAPVNLEYGSDGHEMLAMVCIKHMQCLDPQILFKHLTSAACSLAWEKSECPLYSYTINYWQEHARIADVYSTEVPAMLHKAFMSAITLQTKGELTTKEEIDIGLWLSTLYGFIVLCKTYLEMGGDPNARTVWHETPIHEASARAGGEILLLLVERGGNLALQNEEGFTPLHVACAWGNIEATKVLIECGADINCRTSSGTTAYASAYTPLCLAVLHDHVEIVQMLLSQPKIQISALREDTIARVVEKADTKMTEIILDRMRTMKVAGVGLCRRSTSISNSENPVKQRERSSLGYGFPKASVSLCGKSLTYVYSPLTLPDSVRLIDILPGQLEDEIRCHISHVQLSSHPQYEALSYTWGGSDITDIYCNGNRHQVRTKLEAALRHLRHADTPRTLWVDEICINQNDIKERSCQVRLMAEIYGQAEQVIVWLGEAANDSDSLFDALADVDFPYVGELHTHPWVLALISPARVQCGSRDIPVDRIAKLRWIFSSDTHHLEEWGMLDQKFIFRGMNETVLKADELIFSIEDEINTLDREPTNGENLKNLTKNLARLAHELRDNEQDRSLLDRFSKCGILVQHTKIAIPLFGGAGMREECKEVARCLCVAANRKGREGLDAGYLRESTANSFFETGKVFALLWHEANGDTNRSSSSLNIAALKKGWESREVHYPNPGRMDKTLHTKLSDHIDSGQLDVVGGGSIWETLLHTLIRSWSLVGQNTKCQIFFICFRLSPSDSLYDCSTTDAGDWVMVDEDDAQMDIS